MGGEIGQLRNNEQHLWGGGKAEDVVAHPEVEVIGIEGRSDGQGRYWSEVIGQGDAGLEAKRGAVGELRADAGAAGNWQQSERSRKPEAAGWRGAQIPS